MSKTTYTATLPNGHKVTRTSARAYTHARVLAFAGAYDANSLVSFHGSEALADRPHPDFPKSAWIVVALDNPATVAPKAPKAPKPVEAPRKTFFCAQGHRIPASNRGECLLCD